MRHVISGAETCGIEVAACTSAMLTPKATRILVLATPDTTLKSINRDLFWAPVQILRGNSAGARCRPKLLLNFVPAWRGVGHWCSGTSLRNTPARTQRKTASRLTTTTSGFAAKGKRGLWRLL